MVHKNPHLNELEHSNAIRKITLSDERLDNCLQMQQVTIKTFHTNVQGQSWQFYSKEYHKKQVPEKHYNFR